MAARDPHCNPPENQRRGGWRPPPTIAVRHPQRGKPCIMAHILLVDDDRLTRITVELLLKRAGHEVVAVADGRDGLAKIQAESFDLLIVDIFMPGMDGLETTQAVHRRQPQLPIIVMSGMIFRSASGPAPDFLTMARMLRLALDLAPPPTETRKIKSA
jgi:CheY-like chemotaxis protein